MLLNDNEVLQELQDASYHSGVTTTKVFHGLATTREQLAAVVRKATEALGIQADAICPPRG